MGLRNEWSKKNEQYENGFKDLEEEEECIMAKRKRSIKSSCQKTLMFFFFFFLYILTPKNPRKPKYVQTNQRE